MITLQKAEAEWKWRLVPAPSPGGLPTLPDVSPLPWGTGAGRRPEGEGLFLPHPHPCPAHRSDVQHAYQPVTEERKPLSPGASQQGGLWTGGEASEHLTWTDTETSCSAQAGPHAPPCASPDGHRRAVMKAPGRAGGGPGGRVSAWGRPEVVKWGLCVPLQVHAFNLAATVCRF